MAIDQGSETLVLSKSERTWRVEIFCEKGNDPVIRAHREVISVDPAGNIVRQERGITVDRLLSAIAAETHNGLTGAQLAGIIAERADYWREQDIAAEQSK